MIIRANTGIMIIIHKSSKCCIEIYCLLDLGAVDVIVTIPVAMKAPRMITAFQMLVIFLES